jgi:uncharacterized membrane protein
MTQESIPPLGPPPRRVQVRRRVRNVGRAYVTVFTLMILVFVGWALLDLWNWRELTHNERMLAVGFALLAALSFAVLQLVNYPLRRELRLARRGEVAQGQIVRIGTKPGRRPLPLIVFAFRTLAGAAIEGQCVLPRRFPMQTLAAGMPIEVLYDAKKPRVNKPRLALEFVEFVN